MPVLEMKRLRKSYRQRNQRFLKDFLKNNKPKQRMFEVGDIVDGLSFSENSFLYLSQGHCIRSLIDSQGNNQAIWLVGPVDIMGLSTRFNKLIIPGGARVIEPVIGLEIPTEALLEQAKEDPLLLYENMQHEVMMANSSIRMNSMTKKEKIYYILIELLRETYIYHDDSLQFPKYITQGIIAEFSGVTKGYVSRVISELKEEEIFNPYHVNLICDKPSELISLSEPHCDFSFDDIFGK